MVIAPAITDRVGLILSQCVLCTYFKTLWFTVMCALQCSTKTSFYGKNRKRSPLVEKVKQESKKFCRDPVRVNLHKSLIGRTRVWRLFPTQAEALAVARTLDDDIRVFSYELRESDGGKRAFIVTHPLDLWNVLQMRKPSDRCMYELIAEDAPCKLYFDLEFERKLNPTRDGVTMVKHFIDVVCGEWVDLFGDHCSREDVLWLDSSTTKKFSCHLIFPRMRMFLNNREAGAFVRLLCEKMKRPATTMAKSALAASEASRASPLVLNKSGKEVLFCDEAVYTRNRNFRLFQCTKLNKNTPLVLSKNDCYVRSLGRFPEDRDIFLDSLITWPHQQTSRHLLQLSAGCGPVKRNNGLLASVAENSQGLKSMNSPYPDIDEFIRGIISPRGTIRQVSHFAETDTLVYDVLGYRFCENIGREHRSNGIMYVVDVNVGSFYQKCYDPDCRAMSFRSVPRPLPPECLPSFWLKQIPDEMLV